MNQEPGSNDEINEFVREKYGAAFPMFSKVEVNGPNAHPIFQYLRSKSELWSEKKKAAKEIPWNFSKFLVNADGKIVLYLDPRKDR